MTTCLNCKFWEGDHCRDDADWIDSQDGAPCCRYHCNAIPDPTEPERDLLQEALDWCANHGLVFDYVNENAPDRIAEFGSDPRKISADHYLDDRAGAQPFSWTYLLHLDQNLWNIDEGNIIAVDFDGTLCRNAWPEIGEPNTELIRLLLAAQHRGVRLTLWTCREHPASTPT